MKIFTKTWNYDLNQMPSIGEKVIIDIGNGKGSDRRFPYLVEEIKEDIRVDRVVYWVEGRQLYKNGDFRKNWFQLFFTTWKSEVA